jgi:hypothetical protein
MPPPSRDRPTPSGTADSPLLRVPGSLSLPSTLATGWPHPGCRSARPGLRSFPSPPPGRPSSTRRGAPRSAVDALPGPSVGEAGLSTRECHSSVDRRTGRQRTEGQAGSSQSGLGKWQPPRIPLWRTHRTPSSGLLVPSGTGYIRGLPSHDRPIGRAAGRRPRSFGGSRPGMRLWPALTATWSAHTR